MLTEAWQYLAQWSDVDWWIVATGVVAAMACALPGCFLVVRKQSMMGDALSHAALPGIVLAFLLAHGLRGAGWLSDESYAASRHMILLVGAIAVGILCAVGSELIQKLGRVEASAALGVVFTSLFALGLLLIRLAADSVDIDPDCVLYGTLENVILFQLEPWGVPQAFVTNGVMLLINGALFALFFKELRISAFDPSLAMSLGIHAPTLHYLLMAITAVTLVTAFESVGSILVIAMLIVPAATAYLLTDRLSRMLVLSLVVAAGSAVLGHALATVAPAMIFSRLGYPEVRDASTAGMMAVAAGLLFVAAMFLSPRYGLLSRVVTRQLLVRRVAREDVLGFLFRMEERGGAADPPSLALIRAALARSTFSLWLAIRDLKWRNWIVAAEQGWRLTAQGQAAARQLVRSHRLWESFLARHYPAGRALLHESAARAEHFIDDDLRAELSEELDSPALDPHGATIPTDSTPDQH